MENAADSLTGLTLATGWKVLCKIPKTGSSTGAFFSVCYKVERSGEIAFMKAFDFAKFFSIADGSRSVVDVMGEMIAAFRYERDLSNHCKTKHVTKVSFVRDSGEEIVMGHAVTVVPYLVFEMADGDVRSKLDFSGNLDFAWRLRSLHDIAVGVMQLHKIDVSHQDLKPSNVLVFGAGSKIGDLGRSVCRDLPGPYNHYSFSGDFSYAPPEIMYRVFDSDWRRRVFATDCYLLGSMVVFYFAGISMTALLRKYIPDHLSWERWTGEFASVKPYVLDAFSKSLNEFETAIVNPYFRRHLRLLVEYLCHPIPEERGHPRSIGFLGNNYSLERFVSKLDLLASRAEYLLYQ